MIISSVIVFRTKNLVHRLEISRRYTSFLNYSICDRSLLQIASGPIQKLNNEELFFLRYLRFSSSRSPNQKLNNEEFFILNFLRYISYRRNDVAFEINESYSLNEFIRMSIDVAS